MARTAPPMPGADALYLSDREIGRVLLGPRRAGEFVALAPLLEREGLPQIDGLFGGRYWPAVRLWLDRRNGIVDAAAPAAIVDGQEDFSKWTDRKPRRRRA